MLLGGAPVLWQRFEYKYLVTEGWANLVRGFAQSHLCPDSHADLRHGNQYAVYSLYLDSRDLGLYSSSVAGEKNRFKLRVRFYDERPESPAFFEIKSRKTDVIQKQRAPVRKGSVERIIGSLWMVPGDLTDASAGNLAALQRFCELTAKLTARPKVIVRYTREAYVDPDGGPTRLTLDRHIACLRTVTSDLLVDAPGWLELPDDWVVLEIKFTDSFPNWARDMVQALNLTRTSMAKYVRAVDTLRSRGFGVA